ncbi:unnamed protein product [Ophioblennius macclurei]
MDTIGSSLPSMPEPANPISMKQPPESLSIQKGRGGDMISDPALLMDKAAAQVAATLQDTVLQKMAGHNHERLKDLTSLVLNGDQDSLPKLCAPEPPMLKGAEAPATNGNHHHGRPSHAEPQLKVTIPQVVWQPPFEPCCANDTGETALSGADEAQSTKSHKGRLHKPKPLTDFSSSFAPMEPPDHAHAVEDAAAEEPELTSVPEEPAAAAEPAAPGRFCVGDLVWTKVSGYPWWPCMVTTDPESNNHLKQRQKSPRSRSGVLYHVQYFGDTPERGYVFEKNMVSFSGVDQYQELSQLNKRRASRLVHRKTAPPKPRKLQAQWNSGVAQAKEALGMAPDGRLEKFAFLYDGDEPRLNPHVLKELLPQQSHGTDREAESRLGSNPSAPADVQSKKKRRKKQLQPLAKAVTKRRRKSTSAEDSGQVPARKRKPKVLPPTGDASRAPPVKRERRRRLKRPLTDAETDKDQQPKKRRRAGKAAEKQNSGSEGRPDSPSDSLDGIKKGERKQKEFVCQVCEQPSEELVPCEGQCCGMFHLHCMGQSFKPEDKLICQECSSGTHACFICKKSEGKARRCHVPHCGKFYHEACVRLNPLAVFDNRGFRCPLHTCLSCHYGSHKSTKTRLMRCLRCPVAYHVGDLCVAAGSEMITSTAFVCTNHFHAKKGYSHHSHVNVSWCFVCSKGGQLLCCESCPAAFHPDCLNIAMPDGSWFCNDCRAGKKPKYRDIIWVKLGTYRWWPAEIHHPRNIPTNIQHLRHEIGEFPVFFFGSKDYFWTHQGRVFPYMEGDRGSKNQRSVLGKLFKNAVMEAEARFKEVKLKREAKEAQENSRKPPRYKSIKVNKPFGGVQVYTADISEIPKCNCKPSGERPCGFESECLNRMLQYECHPQVCPSGQRCCNQDFTQRRYPDTKIVKTPGKGWGLISLRDIKKGEFVNEYIGELIDDEECRARIKFAHENNITDFYMLTIDKDRIIDAGPKGNYSRFMNHSCQPNCETQKWTVNGDTRVGLFAVCDIPAGTELTFNYNLDCLGNEKTVCHCGAPNCSGFLGDRPKNSSGPAAEPKAKRMKRKQRRRKTEGKKSDDECFRCGDGGQLVLCCKKTCSKAYHLSCLDLAKRPFGRWDCPWHHCDVCGKNSEAFCQLCPNSFCKAHQEGALRAWPPTGQLCCSEHDESDGPHADMQSAVGAPLRGSRKARTKGSKRKAAEA